MNSSDAPQAHPLKIEEPAYESGSNAPDGDVFATLRALAHAGVRHGRL